MTFIIIYDDYYPIKPRSLQACIFAGYSVMD